MKSIKKLLFACTLLLCCASLGFAQGTPTPTQAAKTRLDAARYWSSDVTSNTTMTLTPNGNEIVVVHEIDVQNCAGASAVTAAGPTTITTTGFAVGAGTNNAAPAFTVGSGVGAGLCTNQSVPYPNGLQGSTPGGSVTFVVPTFATNQTIRINVAWSSAPPPTS